MMTTPPIDAVLDFHFPSTASRPGVPTICPAVFWDPGSNIGLLGTIAINQTSKIIRVDRIC